MTRLAMLGMYDAPYLRAANDALWAVLAARLRQAGIDGVPDGLTRDRGPDECLADPALLFGQTCGYPLVTHLAGRVRPVATPVYATPFTDGPLYRSVIVVRANDPVAGLEGLAGRRAAVNGWDSNSGMNLLRHAVAPLARAGRFFGAVTITGGHLASIAAVAAGDADVAAIDGVTFHLASRHAPEAVAGVRVLAATAATPGLPFVTAGEASDEEVARLRAALRSALADPAADAAKAALGLAGFEVLSEDDYRPVLALEREAAALGYPRLA